MGEELGKSLGDKYAGDQKDKYRQMHHRQSVKGDCRQIINRAFEDQGKGQEQAKGDQELLQTAKIDAPLMDPGHGQGAEDQPDAQRHLQC